MPGGSQPLCGKPMDLQILAPGNTIYDFTEGICLSDSSYQSQCTSQSDCTIEDGNNQIVSEQPFLFPKLFAEPNSLLCSNNQLLENNTSVDDEILIAGEPTWWLLMQGVLGLLGWISRGAIPVDKIKEWFVKHPRVHRALIRGKYEKVFAELSDTKNFYDGVIRTEQMDYGKRDSLENVFRYLIMDKKKLQSQDFVELSESRVRPFLTVESLLKLVIHGYEPPSIDHAAEKVGEELKLLLPEGVTTPIAKLRGLIDGFDASKDFYEGVVAARKMGYGPNSALRLTFYYLFVMKRKLRNAEYQDTNGRRAENYFSLQSIDDLINDFGYKPEQFVGAAENVIIKDLKYEVVPHEILEPIVEVNGQIPPHEIEQSITDTQKLTKIRTDQKEAKEWDMVAEVISTILEQVKENKVLPEEGIEAKVGPYKFKLELAAAGKKGRRSRVANNDARADEINLYVKELEGLLTAINEDGPLTESQMKTVQAIRAHPFIRKLFDVSTANDDHMIAKSEGYEYLLGLAKNNKGVSRALWLMESSPSQPVGLMIQGQPFMDVMMQPPGMSKTPQVNVLSPHFIGPYAFSSGAIFEVKDGSVIISRAAVGTDQNGNRFYISESDFQTLSKLTEMVRTEIEKTPELKEDLPPRVRAFFQLANDLWVIHRAVYPGAPVPEGTPKSVIYRAREFRRVNWGLNLIQTIDQIIIEFRSIPQYVREAKAEPKVAEFIDISLDTQFNMLDEQFGVKFRGDLRDKWIAAAKNLKEAIAAENPAQIAEARAQVESVVREHVTPRSDSKKGNITPYLDAKRSGPRTISFPKEVQAWKAEISSLVESGAKHPLQEFVQNLINDKLGTRLNKFIVARGLEGERAAEPSLERAEEYEKGALQSEGGEREGLIDKAFAEYERLLVEPSVGQASKMTAISQMIKLAIRTYKFHRVKAGLDALNRMVGQGAVLTHDARALVKSMIDFEGKAFPIKVPPILKAHVESKTESIDWSEVFNKWNLINESEQLAVSEKINMWKVKLPGIEYNRGHLRNIALCNEAELKAYVQTFFPDDPIQAYEDIRDFYSEVRPFVKNALVASAVGKKVTSPLSLAKLNAHLEAVEKAEFLSYEDYYDVNMPLDMRLPHLKNSKQFISTSLGVIGPATGSALTFLLSKDAVNAILPAPTSALEAQAQGYSILTTAMVADHGIYKGVEYLVNRKNPFIASSIPEAFSAWKFAGNLGAAAFTYKGIAGTLELLGVDPKWSEITGLVGVGVVYGGWKPFIVAIKPELAAELSRSVALVKGIESAGGKVLVSKLGSKILTAEKYVNGGGAIFLVTDAVFGLADGIISDVSDPLVSQVRDEEYNLWLHNLKQSSYFADTDSMSALEYVNYYDTPWYEKLGNSLHRLATNIIPAGYYKIVWDITGTEWRDWRLGELKKQLYYGVPYAAALNKLWQSASAMHVWFNNQVGEAIWKQHPPDLRNMMKIWTEGSKSATNLNAVLAFTEWQSYAKDHLYPEDQNWLFKNNVVNDGVWADENAAAYWMQAHFLKSLDKMEEYLQDRMEDVADPGDKASISHALQTLYQYEAELGLMVTEYSSKWIGKEMPKALPVMKED